MPRKTQDHERVAQQPAEDGGIAPSDERMGEVAAVEATDALGLQGAVNPDGLADPFAGDVLDDPTDLSSLGGAGTLPDLGVGDESAVDDLANPGGSTLFGDLGNGVAGADGWDPLSSPGSGDASGWDSPIDDQSGWAMDGGGSLPFDPTWLQNVDNEAGERQPSSGEDDPAGGPGTQDTPHTPENWTFDQDDEDIIDYHPHPGTIALEQVDDGEGYGGSGRIHTPASHSGDGESQPSSSDSTPIPDEAGGGFGGDGSGASGAGGIDGSLGGAIDPEPGSDGVADGEAAAADLDSVLIGRGVVDDAPELEESGAGGIDLERIGLGAVDPVGGESTLLDDEGATSLTDLGTQIGGDDLEIDTDLVADVGEDAG